MKKQITRMSLTLIWFAVFFIGITVSSYATNYYVSPSGNDNNNGTTLGTAFLTIVRASQAAGPGDVINVADGTYTGNFTTSKSGTSTLPLTYRSINKWGAKLVGTAPEICWTNSGGYVIIDGFDISSAGRLGFYNTATNNTVMNCYVHDIMYQGSPSPGSGGAGIDNIGANWIVHHNIVLRIDIAKLSGSSEVHGIYTAGINALIYDNLVGGIAAYGIQQWHGASTSKIYNNTVFNCTGGILIGGGDSGVLPNGSQNNFVDNNIVANNTSYGIREYGLTSYNTYRNNILYNNPSNVMNATGDVVSGTITTNPLFVNYLANGTGNYRVQTGSPALDNASTAYVPSTDLDGIARPQGPGYDRGAYEKGSGCVPTAVPAAPSNPAASAVSSSQINLTWTDNATTETAYEVERSLSAGSGFANIATLGPNVTSYNNTTGLSANTTYYYRIRATNCFGPSAYTSVVSATTCPSTVPTTPMYPTATPFSNTQINVGWADWSAIETNYLIERSLNSTINFVQVGSVAANVTTFSDNTGLTANTKYYYRIRAWNCTGYSTYTTVVSATTTPTCGTGTAPGAPSSPGISVPAGAAGTSSLALTWTNGSGTRTGVVIERSTNATDGFTQVANLAASATSYTDWELNSGTLYYYHIRSVNCAGNSAYISTSATTTACSPTSPNGVPTTPNFPTITANSSSQITVGWEDWSSIEAYFVVQRSTSSSSGFVEIARVAPLASAGATTSYVDAGLSSSTTYYYRVYAWNCNGLSTATPSPGPGGAGYVSANATTASGFMSTPSIAPSSSTTTTTTDVSEPVMSKQIIIFPNPSSAGFTLSIPSEIIINGGAMKIYDVFGKEVRSISISNNITTIDRGSLQSGIYYYNIINNNAIIYKGKLMVQ